MKYITRVFHNLDKQSVSELKFVSLSKSGFSLAFAHFIQACFVARLQSFLGVTKCPRMRGKRFGIACSMMWLWRGLFVMFGMIVWIILWDVFWVAREAASAV